MARLYGDVDFTLGGRQYTVRYGTMAWSEARRKLGVKTNGDCVVKVLEAEGSGDFETVLKFVKEGFAFYHPDLTEADIRGLYDTIQQPGEVSVAAAAWEAIGVALPKLRATPAPKVEAPVEPPAAAASPIPKTRIRSGKKR